MSTLLVNTHEAKSRLSELIRLVEAGDEVIVARNGVAVAKLIRWPAERVGRVAGSWRGQVLYHDDIVGPDPEIAEWFEASANQPLP